MKTKIFTLTLSILTCFISSTYAQNPGDLDPSFGNNGVVVSTSFSSNYAFFWDMAIQEDQKIIAVGRISGEEVTDIGTIIVERYLPDGSPDMDFGEAGIFTFESDKDVTIAHCTITDQGKIILAGAITAGIGGGGTSNHKVLLIQLNSDGTLDDSFGDNGIVEHRFSNESDTFKNLAHDVTLDANGNILIAGALRIMLDGQPFVARFSPNGILDTNFGEDGIATLPIGNFSDRFHRILVQPDGKILAGGSYSTENHINMILLVRYNSDGTLDTGFAEDGIFIHSQNEEIDKVLGMALTPEGNILLAGNSGHEVAPDEYYSMEYYALLVNLSPDGSIDTSFGVDGLVIENVETYSEFKDIQVQNDGKIVVGGKTGELHTDNNKIEMAIWKYNPDGTRDMSFGSEVMVRQFIDGYYGWIHGIKLQVDNKIVAVGNNNHGSGDSFILVRLLNDIISNLTEINYGNAPILSPNPVVASSPLNIQLSGTASANDVLEFHSITGKLIHSKPIGNVILENQTLTTTLPAGISNGVYLVRISQAGIPGRATKLVVIK